MITVKKPILFYTIGYPGSGKTTLASQLSQTTGAIHLHADKIGVQIYQIPTFSEAERQYILQEMDWLATNYLRDGTSVIYDANINTRAERDHIRMLAQKLDSEAVGIWVKTPTKIAEQRLKIPKKVEGSNMQIVANERFLHHSFDECMKRFEMPDEQEQILIIPGTSLYTDQLTYLADYVASITV